MDTQEILQRMRIQEGIKDEFDATLPDRVDRYLKAKPHEIIPGTEFAAVSAECFRLFRDGHFYAAIALSQAVVEAIARFLCRKNDWKPEKSFEANVKRLHTRNFISDRTGDSLIKIWEKRDYYHHLNRDIEVDRQKLEALAYDKILLLKGIESEIFKFAIVDGKLVPENPKYWGPLQDGKAQVFLRLE